MYLFEELQLNGILQELSHCAGTMTHKCVFIKSYRLSLEKRKTSPVLQYVSKKKKKKHWKND